MRRWAAKLFELPGGAARLKPMEGIRGMSALLVFFVHFNALFGDLALNRTLQAASNFMASIGHTGVDIFFALSGFIIYGHLIEKKVRYTSFVRRRIVRLYPVFTAVLVVYVFLSLWLPVNNRIPRGFFPASAYLLMNFLMLPGLFPILPLITVAWSLSYELYFYLSLPLLLRLFRLRERPATARTAIIAALSATHLALACTGLLPHPRAVMFSCGILLRETISLDFPWRRTGSVAAIVLLVAWFAVTGLGPKPIMAQYCCSVVTYPGVKLVLLFVATFAFCYFTLRDDGFLANWFRTDWLRWFGNMSYSYYLAHGLMLHGFWVGARFLGLVYDLSVLRFIALGLLGFVVTVVGSAFLFLSVERPLSLRPHG